MTIKSYHIKSYLVTFHSPSIQNWFGVDAETVCFIECFEDEDGHWGDGDYMCRIFFLTEGSDVPPNFHQPQSSAGGLFLRAKELGPVLDVLRNEKPVSVYLNSDHPEQIKLYTGLEPTGEEERSAMFLRK